MRLTRSLTLMLTAAGAAVCAGCSSGTPTATTTAERVVVVSYDGLGADRLSQWLADGVLTERSGLGAQVQEGFSARRLRMANPTMTAVNHPVLATGAWPDRTGIVGSLMRVSGDALQPWTSGFQVDPEVSAVWQLAREAGRRVGTVLWPHMEGETPARRADFGMAWPARALIGPEILQLDPKESEPEPELPVTDGVDARSWRLVVEDRDRVHFDGRVAVLDATPDGRARFDTVGVRMPDGEWRYVRDRGWFELEVVATEDGREHTYAGWCKVLHLHRVTGELRLYRGEVNRLWAYPESFRTRLEAAVGPWPGMPDGAALSAWWLDAAEGIDLDAFMEQAERLDDYLDRATTWILAEEDPDLLMAYHPTPDAVQQAALLVDRRQWAWSEGREFAARGALDRLGRSTDRSVAALWRALDPGRDALIVVSDHGHAPVHDEVRVNQALVEAGLATPDDSGRALAPDSRIRAACSGGAAHLYVNQRGREPGGTVAPEDVPVLLRRAARVLTDLSVEGDPVVERIVSRADLPVHRLDHPNSGDLVVFLELGYTASGALGGPVIQPTPHYGHHGHLARHDALCGVFAARGAGVRRGRTDELEATEVAPFVAALLALSPAEGVR